MAKTSAIALREASGKPKGGKKKLIEVSFEPAEGGAISKTRHRTEGDEYGPSETKTRIHATKEDEAEHLMSSMEDCFPSTGNKPAEGHSSVKK
jgi:hypothetical protein